MRTAHFSDDRLVEIYFTDTLSAQEQQHLGVCPDCDRRRSEMAHLLDETAMAANEDVEAAFPADRLARQQARIMELAESVAGPARIITFPSTPAPAAQVTTRARSTRWVAAAAVAGLVVGLAAGRAGRELQPSAAPSRLMAGPATQEPGEALRVLAPMSDDQFLFELETAIESRGGETLRALDELTPRAWEQ